MPEEFPTHQQLSRAAQLRACLDSTPVNFKNHRGSGRRTIKRSDRPDGPIQTVAETRASQASNHKGTGLLR
jgi:hypothetical protein